jgi:alpha-glucosidase
VVETIRRTARAINPDIYVMGEIFSYPAEWLRCLDGVMNYSWQSAAGALFEGRIGSRVFGAFLARFADDAGIAGLSDSLSMLTSHDTPRLRDLFDGDLRRMEHALLLQFTLPGIPMIWAGEELGMEGKGDHRNRQPIPWGTLPDRGEARSRFDRLIRLRQERAELHRGDFVELSALLPEGVVGFLRRVPLEPGAFCLVLINVSAQRQAFTLFLPESHLYSTMSLSCALGGPAATFVVGAADIALEPGNSRVYLPQPRGTYPNYSFYKNRGCDGSAS